MPPNKTPSTMILRPLSALEKMFWLADQNRPLHFAIAAEVGGATRVVQWQDALDEVCRQSALIWSRIVPGHKGEPTFEPVVPGSIPLRVVENAEAEWSRYIADELDEHFDASQAPLLRATLLHGAERSVIILSVHHSVADGLALSFLLRDLLRTFAGEAVRLSTETASTEHLIAATDSKLPMPQPAAAISPMPYRPMDGSRARVNALCLTREATRSLRELARSEGTTVQGALCAAVTTAAAKVVPGWADACLRVLSPIDVRGRMLNGSEHFGLCVTAAVLEDERTTDGFWSRARSFSDRLEPAAASESISTNMAMLHNVMSQISTVQQAEQFLAQAFSAEILLTNLGAIEYKETYGSLALDAVWGPAVHSGFARGQTIGTVTVRDQLRLLHTSYGPANDLLSEVSLLLRTALREGVVRAG
jgi:NRPS condensation-like uncharacterized protein